MPDIIRNVRGRGPNGWVRVVGNSWHMTPSDPIVRSFMHGLPMSELARAHKLSTRVIEAVIRWYLLNPKVMRRVLGEHR